MSILRSLIKYTHTFPASFPHGSTHEDDAILGVSQFSEEFQTGNEHTMFFFSEKCHIFEVNLVNIDHWKKMKPSPKITDLGGATGHAQAQAARRNGRRKAIKMFFFPQKTEVYFFGLFGSFDGGFSWEILISWPMYDLNLMILAFFFCQLGELYSFNQIHEGWQFQHWTHSHPLQQRSKP